MARQRKYNLVPFDENDPGITSYPNSALEYKIIGEISDSGDLYVSNKLKKRKTITFILRDKPKAKVPELLTRDPTTVNVDDITFDPNTATREEAQKKYLELFKMRDTINAELREMKEIYKKLTGEDVEKTEGTGDDDTGETED